MNETLQEEIRTRLTYAFPLENVEYGVNSMVDLIDSLKKEHAIKLAAAHSNHDLFKTYHKGFIEGLAQGIEGMSKEEKGHWEVKDDEMIFLAQINGYNQALKEVLDLITKAHG